MNFESILECYSELDENDDVGDGSVKHAGDGGPLNGEQPHARDFVLQLTKLLSYGDTLLLPDHLKLPFVSAVVAYLCLLKFNLQGSFFYLNRDFF